MRFLNVACAIIEHDGLTLVVQRSAEKQHGLLWEFPGGKLEAGEEASDCIVREIQEELGITVQVREQLSSQEHGHIRLIPFICNWKEGNLILNEHKEARWLLPDDLHELSWCPADIPVVNEYTRIFKKSPNDKKN